MGANGLQGCKPGEPCAWPGNVARLFAEICGAANANCWSVKFACAECGKPAESRPEPCSPGFKVGDEDHRREFHDNCGRGDGQRIEGQEEGTVRARADLSRNRESY